VPILKPVISLAVAGALALSAYAQLNQGQRGTIASVEKAVVDTVGSGIGWMSTTIAAWVPYRLPRMEPNGDIVIKRLSPDQAPPAAQAPVEEERPQSPAATNT
jgi:sugar/nucleoside kinase (ribokinase family)